MLPRSLGGDEVPGFAVGGTPNVARGSVERVEPPAEEPELVLINQFTRRITRLPTRASGHLNPVENTVIPPSLANEKKQARQNDKTTVHDRRFLG